MKTSYLLLRELIIKPIRQWIRRIINKQDDDDNQFNHPWAIF
ncbi:MAG: hypothetical protein ABJB86_23330 [Bacteroidota bacterium]